MSNLKLESSIQDKILKHLEERGIFAVKVMVANKNGVPDILFCHKGRFGAIEVKREKGSRRTEPAELQKRNIKRIREAGGIAFPAWSVEDVVLGLQNFEKPQRMVQQAFISGRVTGLERKEVIEKFTRSEFILKRKGYDSWNPVRKIPAATPWKKAMEICLKHLLDSDLVYFQADWRESEGSRIEHEIAQTVGKTCLFEDMDSVESYLGAAGF